MKYLILITGTLTIFLSGIAQSSQDSTYYCDLLSDTWVGTDALGRKMPTYADVGPVKKDQRRVVGIFYITWHSDALYSVYSPYQADVNKILKNHPEARLDGTNPVWDHYSSYHWGEPENGYFLSKDKYVIRKDMSMLADAGVDVLIMDVTNAVHYWDEWKVVFSVMEQMKSEGNKVPKFCFWAFNGTVITVVQDLYDRIYKEGKYKDIWFYWDGKPLLLYNGSPNVDANGAGVQNPNPHYDGAALTDVNDPHYGDPDYTEKYYKDYTKDIKEFFTLRTMWWGYYQWAGKRFVGTEDNWSFGLDMGDKRVSTMSPIQLASKHHGKVEEFPVTPAQHASTMIGKSWTKKDGEPQLNEYDLPDSTYVPWLDKKVAHPEDYGIYFQQRWNQALEANPQFLYLNDWNEWTAGKYAAPEGKTYSFMRRRSNFRFIDQYNAEFNRTISPMKGSYADNYYMQMAENIRKYKGVRPIPVLKGLHTIKMDDDFSDWKQINVEYRDTKGDTYHRDYNGYGGLHYINNSGRNDIVTCKVAVDTENIYFYAETNDSLTPYTGKNWMLLFIDADKNSNTGWYGYDFLINKNINNNSTSLMKYDTTEKKWVEISRLKYNYKGNKFDIAVPRELLGLESKSFMFDFHWCDNPADLKDPISLCINGDSAPNRRFNYRCIYYYDGAPPCTTAIVSQPRDTAICEGEDAIFKVTTTENALIYLKYQWQLSTDGKNWSDINGANTSMLTIKDAALNANGIQYRVVIKADCNSVTSFAAKLTVSSIPQITITADKSNPVVKGEIVHLTATSRNSINYQWEDSADIISGQQSAVLEVQPHKNTTYRVIGTNGGCRKTASISLKVAGGSENKHVQNILTPNGDGKNDTWRINDISNYPGNEVRIFDRTGRMVYHQKSYDNTWNGTSNNGKLLHAGTYYYIFLSQGQESFKGYITIIRK